MRENIDIFNIDPHSIIICVINSMFHSHIAYLTIYHTLFVCTIKCFLLCNMHKKL